MSRTSAYMTVRLLVLALYMYVPSPTIAERETFRWVQKHISAFGGDPTKVTMYALSLLDTPVEFAHTLA